MTERNGPGAAGGLSEASTCSEKANGEKQETPPEVHGGEVEEHPRGGSAASPGGLAEAPDGGWGWVVLLATIMVLALTLAFPSCVGIFYTDLQNDFHASNSETSWVPSIMTSVLHAGGRVHNLFSQCSVTLSASECIQVCLPAYRITCYVFIIFYFGFTVMQHSASCCCFFMGYFETTQAARLAVLKHSHCVFVDFKVDYTMRWCSLQVCYLSVHTLFKTTKMKANTNVKRTG